MKRFAKLALGALILAGAATAAAAPASARVVVGVGLPIAAPVTCDPYSRFYDPYYCAPAYAGPVVSVGGYFGGGWHDGWRGGFHDGFRGGFHHR
jgi:hypothetical protein